LRVGWIVAKEEIINQVMQIKQAMDLQASSLTQVVLSLYLKEHPMEDHIARCREFYRGRRDSLLESMERHFPSEVKWTKPDAGFSVWAELPESISGDDLLKTAIDKGVAIEPGEPFFPTEKHQNFIRLSYSNLDPEQMEEGVRRLSGAIKDHIAGAS
jgi:2-aminoadipate transaminase